MSPAASLLSRPTSLQRAGQDSPSWTTPEGDAGDALPLVDRPTGAPARASMRRRAVVAVLCAAAAVAAWMLYDQVSHVDFGPVLASAQWGWVLVTAACFALTLVGSALNLIACSPVPLPPLRTYAVQVACGFVRFISPTALGGAALNARFVQKAGASTPLALASVGTAQVIQVATTVGLLAVLAPVTGTAVVPPAVRGQLLWAAIGVAAVATLVLAAVPGVRAQVPRLLASTIARVRAVTAARGSALRRLTTAAAGAVLLTVGLVLALTASVAAMGGVIAPVPIGMAFLVGSAVGSMVPTPGGIGTVEAALVAALVASGQLVAVALPAVLVFRLVTVWLQVPLGWAALQVLHRNGHV